MARSISISAPAGPIVPQSFVRTTATARQRRPGPRACNAPSRESIERTLPRGWSQIDWQRATREPLQVADFAALVAALHDLAAPCSIEAFPAVALAFVQALIPGVRYRYTDLGLHRERTTAAADPATMLFIGGEDILRHSVPVQAHFAGEMDHGALACADALTRRSGHHLGLYADLGYCVDTEDDATLSAPSGASLGIVIHRGRAGFTHRDRMLLDLARPHLTRAYQNAQFIAGMHAAFVASAHPAMVLDAEGGVQSASPGAWNLLAAYFDPAPSRHSLPDPVRRWVRAQRRPIIDDPAPSPLMVERGDRRLHLRLFAGAADYEESQSLLVLHEWPGDSSVAKPVQAGLTGREREMTALVAGKTNREIAAMLYLSEKTVEMHVSNALRKLGFRTRTELAVWAASAGLAAMGTPFPNARARPVGNDSALSHQ